MSEALELFKKSKKDIPEIRYVLPGSGHELLLKPFTTKDQKAILKAIEDGDELLIQEAFDQLLRNCVLSEKFDPDSLFSKDRECLLMELSKCSVKDDIDHQWQCEVEECKEVNVSTVAVSDLPYEERVAGSMLEKEILFEDHDFSVVLGIPTRGDEKRILGGAKKGNKISQTEVIVSTLASVMKKYKKIEEREMTDEEGNKTTISNDVYKELAFSDKLKMYEMLSPGDKKKIEGFFGEIKSYGYDLEIKDQKCPKCNNIQDVSLEWVSFFLT